MEENRKEILIIDDSVDVIKILIELLLPKYKTYFAKEGLKGIELAKKRKPDLILLDILMYGINGYEVCRRLKLDKDTADIPVIFVTAVSEAMDEAKAFGVGGADYITKPFTPIVVMARIANHLQLSAYMLELKKLYKLALDANPITGMPGNNSIKKFIEKSLTGKKDYHIFYADLDNFKSYNDKYGFAYGDKVILFTSDLFHKVADDIKCTDIFIGHIGGDDFVLLVSNEFAIKYIEVFLSEFDRRIKDFYSESDLERGYIISKNRMGRKEKFPIMTISIAGVDLTKRTYSSYLQINDICTAIKSRAKKIDGSNYIIDKRAY